MRTQLAERCDSHSVSARRSGIPSRKHEYAADEAKPSSAEITGVSGALPLSYSRACALVLLR